MKRRIAVFEDTTMAYNRWTQGIASREQTASMVGLANILDDKRARPLNDKTKKDIPIHPTLVKTPDIIGSLVLNLDNLKCKLTDAQNSNLADDPETKMALKHLLTLVHISSLNTKCIIKCLEKIA